MNLKYKTFLPLLSLGALIVLYLALVWLPDTIRDERTKYIEKIDEHLASLSRTLLIPVLDTDFAKIYGSLNTVMAENPYWTDLSLFNADGIRLYPLQAKEPPTAPSGYVLRRSIDYLGEEIGTLVLTVDIDSELAEGTSQLKQLIALALVAIILLLAFTGLIIELVVRRPLIRLAQASNRLRSGDFNALLPKPGRDEVGRLVSSFGAMRRAIKSYQQKLEKEVAEHKRTTQALRESSRKYRTLYDDTPAMFFTLDLEGQVLSANRFGAAQLQYSVDELIGMPAVRLYARSCRENFERSLQSCVDEPARVHRWELQKLRKDGASLWVRESARLVRGSTGQPAVLIVCEDITEARNLSNQLAYQATHDALTGLVNRREFERRLQGMLDTARTAKAEHALCYLDLDQFKLINDTCGHVAGDELLRQLAGLFLEQVRKHDTVARLGGDEFGLLLDDCALDNACSIANKLRSVLAYYRFIWQGKSFSVGASVGLVPINETSTNINDVLSAADHACYAAKDQGRNRVHVYCEDDAELAKRHREIQWVTHIQQALESQRLQLAYQPIAPIKSNHGRVIHYELLLRMIDTKGHTVLPKTFLPAAERYNLTPRLDRWVISEVFRWLARDTDRLNQPSLYFINLSHLSIGDGAFLGFIMAELEQWAIPPGKICFELTESATIANLSNSARFMRELKALGCWFALDDFGIGISSFAYLKSLPVDFLKIDGLFIRDIVADPIDLAMVRSINDIGKVMGKQTVAERVENATTLAKLKDIGVDYAQGNHIDEPRPIDRDDKPLQLAV
jgi:diguanylate cyclase (GGDEF)-like protein/PAS domain S-box-containing protein